MKTLGVILARAGSKGLPRKNALPLAGRPMIAWTVQHARQSASLSRYLVSTDGEELASIARDAGAEVILRPPELAHDTATVDAAARHALEQAEAEAGETFDAVVILYGNVPLRPADLTDRAVAKLARTGCDSVQSVCPVGKMHPYWMKQLAGDAGDVLEPWVENQVYRRQDLPPVYMLDGGIIAVTRASLLTTAPDQPHAFLGRDRRAVVTEPGEVVDVDTATDLRVAEAILADRGGQES
ncbi:MAG: cytidylyltransferase domain-containing protein [Phycisphaeraceae bacterium]